MIVKKLNNRRGETLIETLAAILVASMSTALLFFAVTASVRINEKAAHNDAGYYESISAAEKQETVSGDILDKKATIQGNGQTFETEIVFYGGNGMYSYRREGPP